VGQASPQACLPHFALILIPESIDLRKFDGAFAQLPTMQLVAADIEHDAVQPGREACRAPKRGEVGIDTQKRLEGDDQFLFPEADQETWSVS
jgi:hypothetical protein